MSLTHGSLFDGIGGMPLAAHRAGIKTLWSSEIEPFCIAVTKRHFPDVVQLGDIRNIDGRKVDPVDIISSTSPCQDLSIAGKRQGLEGEQSSLFFESTRIVREMREATNGRYPRFFVWENVPGAFSSHKGEDFRLVLEDIARIVEEDITIPLPPRGKWTRAGLVRGEGWSIAWRILDAQYFGVPQRRRRIVLIADFGSDRAGEVLFEREGVCGNSQASGEAWSDYSRTASGSSRIDCTPDGISGAVSAKWHKETGGPAGDEHYNLVVVPIPQPYDMTHANEAIRVVEPDRCPTLQRRMGAGGNQTPTLVDVAFAVGKDVVNSLTESFGGAGPDLAHAEAGWLVGERRQSVVRVRRLTPLECERLQSFPDGWTEGGSDTARYKALGNAVNVNVFTWVFRRLYAYANGVSLWT